MPRNEASNRYLQVVACSIAAIFVAGFFVHPIGMWTGAIPALWFACSQRPWRGFLWMTAITIVFSAGSIWHSFAHTVLAGGPGQTVPFLGSVLTMIVFGVLPLTFHRVVSRRLPGFASTLPFPVATIALAAIAKELKIDVTPSIGALNFFTCWFAAVVLWMWDYEFRGRKISFGGAVFAAAAMVTAGVRFSGAKLPDFTADTFGWSCLGAALLLSIWALFHPEKQRAWANRSEAIAKLRSPFTGSAMHWAREGNRELLVSDGGERFSIENGIPTFLKPTDFDGNNGKYRHLYETIGGLYDDIQRVFCDLAGFNRDRFFRSYMHRVEAKAGDEVLETSVGTGLNFKYLPVGARLTGLDLSAEMLAHCQVNLARWELDADLYMGNAETLPFADESFDVVFHSGGINFFNDRAKAIREMIRVAKPGSLLLVADETEKHVKGVYQKMPGGLYNDRKEEVSAPIELVPTEMEELHCEILRGGDFYALTFRKPKAMKANGDELKPIMTGSVYDDPNAR
jgi:ubiquinone/menaquinone biosynthesis C-methylase UbiE